MTKRPLTKEKVLPLLALQDEKVISLRRKCELDKDIAELNRSVKKVERRSGTKIGKLSPESLAFLRNEFFGHTASLIYKK